MNNLFMSEFPLRRTAEPAVLLLKSKSRQNMASRLFVYRKPILSQNVTNVALHRFSFYVRDYIQSIGLDSRICGYSVSLDNFIVYLDGITES